MPDPDPRDALNQLTQRVDAIELFRTDVTVPRHFSFGTWWNRQHVIVKIASGEHAGWAEAIAALNRPNLDVPGTPATGDRPVARWALRHHSGPPGLRAADRRIRASAIVSEQAFGERCDL